MDGKKTDLHGETDVEENATPAAKATRSLDRRSLIAKGAAAGGVLWVAPLLTSIPVAASSAPVPLYQFAMTGVSGPHLIGNPSPVRTVTINGTVQVGDLILVVAAYSADGTINVPAGFTTIETATVSSGIYSVQAVLCYRIATATSFTATFTTGNDGSTFGDLRVAAVVYSGSNLAILDSDANSGTGPADGRTVTATFPATAVSSPVGNNKVVRIGVGRGYGGLNAANSSMTWVSSPTPNAPLVNYNERNRGDRPIVIADESSGTGLATTATYDKNANLAPSRWVTFSVTIEAH